MGRKGAAGKRGAKGKGGGGDAESDETDNEDADRVSSACFSLASAADTATLEAATEGRLLLSEAVENLGEKRASIREGALKSLTKVLRSGNKGLVDSVLDNYSDALLTPLLKLLRRPASDAEGLGCLQVAALYCLLLGSDENAAFEAMEKVLVPLMHDDVAEGVRVKALATLAFACFVCSSDATDRVMTLLEDVLCEESEGAPATATLRARAAQAWQLLASVAPTEAVLERSKARVFEAVAELLDDGEADVRIAAGLVLAGMWEVAVADDDGNYSGGAAAATDCRVSGLALCENPAVVSQAVATLQRVAKDSSKRVSKRDRKEQRAALRDAEAWVVGGEAPAGEVVRLQGAVLNMTTFAQLRLLEELREVLGDGLPSSLRVFPVLQDVLGVAHLADAMDGDGCDSAVKKGSATEKLRSGYRKQERSYRDISTAFGGGYDDDDGGFGDGGDGWGADGGGYEKKGGRR